MNLKDEILAGESATLEFKRCPNENAERWLKTVVAFANGKGGRILFGVDNNRTVVGVGNETFAEYGVRPVELEDAGLSTRMTVWRNKKAEAGSREVVNTPSTSSREGVNTPSAHREGVFTTSANNHEGVNALKKKTVCAGRCSNGQFSGVVDKLVPVVYKKVRSTPGARMSDLMTVAEASRATIERVLARLQREGKVEFRGAPKNGGYYCK